METPNSIVNVGDLDITQLAINLLLIIFEDPFMFLPKSWFCSGAIATLPLCLLGLSIPLLAGSLPNPRWKVQVLLYETTAVKYVESATGAQHLIVTYMSPPEMTRASNAARRFFEVDVPALTGGAMNPIVTVTIVKRPLTGLDIIGCGWWPSPNTTAPDLLPGQFDSAVVVWKDYGIDTFDGRYKSLACYGGLTWPRGLGQTYASFTYATVSDVQRNVFKHEWGHSILFYYSDAGKSPTPAVNNHINNADAKYVHCHTGTSYVLVDDSDVNPIPNSIYNNLSGFSKDYYSGVTATADQPDRCLGLAPSVWASGGPLTRPIVNPGNLNGDSQVDRVDLSILMTALGQNASGPNDPRDLDYDGKITIFDARRLVTFCTKPNCAQ